MKLIEYPDRELLTLSLAQEIQAQLGQALRAQGRASLCLPGGSTPAPLMAALSGAALDWADITVFAGDERCVPLDHPRSNHRLIGRHLLVGRAAAARLVALYDPADEPADEPADTPDGVVAPEVVAAAAARIAPHLPISALVVGMGTDMHTASLFPGAPGLAEALSGAGPVAATRAPDGEARLTLTAPVLAAAQAVHLLILGADKRAAIDRAAGLDAMAAPIRALWPELTVHWAE